MLEGRFSGSVVREQLCYQGHGKGAALVGQKTTSPRYIKLCDLSEETGLLEGRFGREIRLVGFRTEKNLNFSGGFFVDNSDSDK